MGDWSSGAPTQSFRPKDTENDNIPRIHCEGGMSCLNNFQINPYVPFGNPFLKLLRSLTGGFMLSSGRRSLSGRVRS
jgi:hypothetical protein